MLYPWERQLFGGQALLIVPAANTDLTVLVKASAEIISDFHNSDKSHRITQNEYLIMQVAAALEENANQIETSRISIWNAFESHNSWMSRRHLNYEGKSKRIPSHVKVNKLASINNYTYWIRSHKQFVRVLAVSFAVSYAAPIEIQPLLSSPSYGNLTTVLPFAARSHKCHSQSTVRFPKEIHSQIN